MVITTATLDPFRGYGTVLHTLLPDAARLVDPFHVTRPAIPSVDVRCACSRTPPGAAAAPATRCTSCAGYRVTAATGSARMPGTACRLAPTAGEPTGEIALAPGHARKFRILYRLDDATVQVDRAQTLIASLLSCPIQSSLRAPNRTRLARRTLRRVHAPPTRTPLDHAHRVQATVELVRNHLGRPLAAAENL
jgi:hypothetical protein